MVSSKYMIGVDIGTTSTKSVLFSTDGSVIASHGIEYPYILLRRKQQNKTQKKFSCSNTYD